MTLIYFLFVHVIRPEPIIFVYLLVCSEELLSDYVYFIDPFGVHCSFLYTKIQLKSNICCSRMIQKIFCSHWDTTDKTTSWKCAQTLVSTYWNTSPLYLSSCVFNLPMQAERSSKYTLPSAWVTHEAPEGQWLLSINAKQNCNMVWQSPGCSQGTAVFLPLRAARSPVNIQREYCFWMEFIYSSIYFASFWSFYTLKRVE